MANFEKAIKTLEFDRVLEQLAAAAQTEGAKDKAMRIMPQTSLPRIRKLQMQTSDARKLMGIKGTPPFEKFVCAHSRQETRPLALFRLCLFSAVLS